jgi:PAS domain-containing protein
LSCTYLYGRSFGRLAAAFASLGIGGALLTSHYPPASGSISDCAVAITTAWFCAELFSRRPRQSGATPSVKKEPFDWQPRQQDQILQDIDSLLPGHMWIVLPDGGIEYLSPGLREYTGIKESRECDFFRAALHPVDQIANDCYWDTLRAGDEPGELEFRLRRLDGEYRWFLCRVKAMRNGSGRLLRLISDDLGYTRPQDCRRSSSNLQ